MTCLVCYLDQPTAECPDCGKKLLACEECASDMGENFCARCDKEVDPD